MSAIAKFMINRSLAVTDSSARESEGDRSPRPATGDSADDDRADDDRAARVAAHLLRREGAGPTWGLVIEEARLGFARVRMVVRDDMLNGHRTVHGGMVFALADSAFACACNSRDEITVGHQA